MRERIDGEEKKSTISRGGCLVAAHSGHRTSEGPELVGTQDAYRSDNGDPARGPPGPVLQADNKGLPRRVGRPREHAWGHVRGRRKGGRRNSEAPLPLSEVTLPKNARQHS